MKMNWNTATEAWSYQLEGRDLCYEKTSSQEKLNLVLVVCTDHQEARYVIPVVRA